MRIGIIGGGNGGLALGGELINKGHSVSLWNRTEQRIRSILDAGNIIEVDNEGSKYYARFEEIRYGYPISFTDPEIIFIITPSIAHEDLGSRFPRYIPDTIPIVLMPGRTFGSYAFLKNAKTVDPAFSALCIETQTLLHACRSYENKVYIYGTKKKVKFSSLQKIPANVINKITSLLPEMEYCSSYLEVALNNVGAFFHPVPTILNSGWIESGLVFKHYVQGISRRIADLIQKMDDEKKAVCDKLKVHHVSLIEWLNAEYGAEGRNLYECIQSVKAYQEINSPSSLDHRYINDDLITGLVPIYKTARVINVEVPIIEAFLKFSCLFLNRDYISEGREFPKEYFKEIFRG
jgi:opine dehydrogenase